MTLVRLPTIFVRKEKEEKRTEVEEGKKRITGKKGAIDPLAVRRATGAYSRDTSDCDERMSVVCTILLEIGRRRATRRKRRRRRRRRETLKLRSREVGVFSKGFIKDGRNDGLGNYTYIFISIYIHIYAHKYVRVYIYTRI